MWLYIGHKSSLALKRRDHFDYLKMTEADDETAADDDVTACDDDKEPVTLV